MLVWLRLLALPMFVGLLVYLANPRWMAWASLSIPGWIRWIAAGAAVLQVAVLVWVFRSLGGNVTPSVETRLDHYLVVSGPYRWVRHPLYTVGVLFWLTLSVLTALWFFVAVSIPALLLLVRRTPLEEEQLFARFGDDYRRYCQRTGRYLPRFRR